VVLTTIVERRMERRLRPPTTQRTARSLSWSAYPARRRYHPGLSTCNYSFSVPGFILFSKDYWTVSFDVCSRRAGCMSMCGGLHCVLGRAYSVFWCICKPGHPTKCSRLGAELIMFDVSCRRLRRAERKVRLSLPKIIHRLEILLGWCWRSEWMLFQRKRGWALMGMNWQIAKIHKFNTAWGFFDSVTCACKMSLYYMAASIQLHMSHAFSFSFFFLRIVILLLQCCYHSCQLVALRLVSRADPPCSQSTKALKKRGESWHVVSFTWAIPSPGARVS